MLNPRAQKTLALLRARRAAMGHGRNERGHYHPGRSGNPGGLARGRLPRQQPPKAVEREYAAALVRMVGRAREAHAPLLAELHGLAASAVAERRQDAGEGARARALVQRARDAFERTFRQADMERLAREFAQRTATHQRVQLNRQTRAALGVDAPIADKHAASVIDGFVHENVALIKSIPSQLHDQVEQVVTRGLQAGTLGGDLAEEVENRFSVAESRARLIARDQVGKLNGQISQARNQEMGLTHYIWRTAQDERVRGDPGGKYPKAWPSHFDREGKRYSYSAPPEGGPPGQAILCRCYDEPDFSPILGEEDEDGGDE